MEMYGIFLFWYPCLVVSSPLSVRAHGYFEVGLLMSLPSARACCAPFLPHAGSPARVRGLKAASTGFICLVGANQLPLSRAEQCSTLLMWRCVFVHSPVEGLWVVPRLLQF